MASLYKRPRSPFWWITFYDLDGRRRQKSTGLKHAVPADTRKAHALCEEISNRETRGQVSEERWDDWVPRFIEQKYAGRERTRQRYEGSWRNIQAFLRAHEIAIPRQLTRKHCRDYPDWRSVDRPDAYACCKNTAILELKLLGMIMREAVQSGFATVNPCERLGIPREAPPKKPRITDDEHKAILAALESEPEWMRISYRIAWEQGCRFSETCLPLSDVDLDKMVIRFRTKGRKEHPAEFPLSPNLVPMFQDMKARGRKVTFKMPSMPGKEWWRFFKRIGLPHLCFHCTRVTFITRCYEAGVPREAVMRLAGHSSYAVHSIYPRLTADHNTVQSMRHLLDKPPVDESGQPNGQV